MDIPWDDVRLFLAVAETGSVSAAARRLRLGQPTVSRRLAALEYALGAKLFRRSVEGTALTTAGERLLSPARKMAEWAAEVDRASESRDRELRGQVRVTAAPGLAFEFVAPFAAVLKQRHPGLRLEVLASMQNLDMVRGEADLALRIRPATQPELVTVESLRFPNAVFVAKELAAKLPRKPRLADVPWVAWAPPWDSMPPNPQLEAAIPGFTPAFASDSFLVNLGAAEAGLGAIILGRVRHRFSRPTRLVPLNIDLGPFNQGELHLVAAKSALDIPRVRIVAELLVQELKRAVPG